MHQTQIDAKMNCAEYAIVGLWDLDWEKDTLVCKRFFYIPNPLKRIVKNTDGTKLYQVLYVSEHTKEVFFFFKGYEQPKNEDLGLYQPRQYQTQCAFLDLDPDLVNKIKDERDRAMDKYCSNFTVIKKESVLQKFLLRMNESLYKDQEQLPNPTVIDAKDLMKSSTEGKIIVFTAYLLEERPSSNWWSDILGENHQLNPVHHSFYPTVFFYSLNEKRTVWEIFGSQLFIKISDSAETVFTLTNELWSKVSGEELEYLKKECEQIPGQKFSIYDKHYETDQGQIKARIKV